MRTLAFDGRMGASGDMLLAALIAAGADPAALDPVEDTLGASRLRGGVAGRHRRGAPPSADRARCPSCRSRSVCQIHVS